MLVLRLVGAEKGASAAGHGTSGRSERSLVCWKWDWWAHRAEFRLLVLRLVGAASGISSVSLATGGRSERSPVRYVY